VAVHSNTFGGLHLTGADARKFRNQAKYGRPNKAAKTSAAKGVASAKVLLANGQVKVAEPTS
jgi:hypothetical protein